MTEALAIRGPQRHPSQASGRLRRAAEHYVRSGCKAIGPSLISAGYAKTTAKDPARNGYTHDRLVDIARYYDRGAQASARAHLGDAISTLKDLLDPSEPGNVRGTAAKILADMAGREAEATNETMVAAEEQAKWMALVRHWKRTFLRRGILLGQASVDWDSECIDPNSRGARLLCDLNYMLGKGPIPEWMAEEEDGETVLGPEGDTRPRDYDEAEIVEEQDGIRAKAGDPAQDETGPWTDPTCPE